MTPGKLPLCCHCPSDLSSDVLNTSYVMVVGSDTISAGATSTSMKDLNGPISQTIMIVEMSDSGILWTEPRDLNFDEMSLKVNDPDGGGTRSRHPGHVNVALFDGQVHSFREDVSPEVLKVLLRRHGGETMDRAAFYSH